MDIVKIENAAELITRASLIVNEHVDDGDGGWRDDVIKTLIDALDILVGVVISG